MYELQLSYAYSFYNFGEILDSDVRFERIAVDAECRFKLYQQEDSSFVLSELCENSLGKYVVLTHPNKDSVVIYENEIAELVYDEYFDSMGDDNHNVYEGAIVLKKVEN